jgi:thioredoxin reductase
LKGRLATEPATGHLVLEAASARNGFARTQTSVDGIFAAGDVADPYYRSDHRRGQRLYGRPRR